MKAKVVSFFQLTIKCLKTYWKGEVMFLRHMFFSQGFIVAAAAGGFFQLAILQTGLMSLATGVYCVEPSQTSSYMYIPHWNFFVSYFRNCQTVREKKPKLKQLCPGRSRTVLCNHGQETVGGHRLRMIWNLKPWTHDTQATFLWCNAWLVKHAWVINMISLTETVTYDFYDNKK